MLARKPTTPIDRAMADVERQIADLEQKMRATESTHHDHPAPPSRVTDTVKEWFRPPSRRFPVSARHATIEVSAEPLKELDDGSFPFAHQPEPDLFSHAKSSEKLAQYLNAGGVKQQRQPLKHVQRQNRRQFYIWLTLGIVALGLLWFVVH